MLAVISRANQRVPTLLRALSSGPSASSAPAATKRMWESAEDALRDHKRYVSALPGILGACESAASSCEIYSPALHRHTSRHHHQYQFKGPNRTSTCCKTTREGPISMLRIAYAICADVGPNAIEPQLNEAIMVTVNSAKQCPYCTGPRSRVNYAH